MSVKPVLFNTEMVRAILDGRKTVTRRVIDCNKVDTALNSPYRKEHPELPDVHMIRKLILPKYNHGDILYVRETYCPNYFDEGIAGYRGDLRGNRNAYKADFRKEILSGVVQEPKWRPSIHMPKEAARIWLKVTDVRVERLQDITWQQAAKEGFYGSTSNVPDKLFNLPTLRGEFSKTWDSTIKKSDLGIYGWEANPWVWVIEFERCDKPKEGERFD